MACLRPPAQLTLEELRAELGARGVEASGRKAVLVQLLADALIDA